MSYVERHTVSVTTAADGTATGYTPVVSGRVVDVIYAKTDFADTADFAITAESTGLNIWTESNVTASKTVSPMQPAHDQAGVLQDTGGDVWETYIFVAQERVKIAIAGGGDTKTGTFTFVIA